MNKRFCIAALLAAAGTGAHAQQLTTEIYQTGLARPVFTTHAGDGSGRMFVLEQAGRIRIIDSGGTLQTAPFLDIDGFVTGGASGQDERGLLGLAFHPDYETNGKFYVNYTTTISGQLTTVIDEFSVSAGNPNQANPLSGRRLLPIAQPFGNHNGGWLGFGPDGYLYIANGDGGSGNDPGNRAARLNFLLGKLLRIDVDNQDPGLQYAIPPGNPFADDGDANTLAEIWDYGLRNPWRTSFDRETGDLWIADVGQFSREEVNFQPAGDPGGNHYGWRCREGFNATGLAGCPASNPEWVSPVHDYGRGDGCSITGGYAYRGCELGDAFEGKYFFSDFCSGTIWYLDPDNNFARTTAFDTNFNVSSFGEGEDGEIFITNLFAGTIYKLVLTNPDPDNCLPDFPGCNPADLAEPYDTLNFFDVTTFLGLYNQEDPAADLAPPAGVFNFFDVTEFLSAYNSGCP